MDSTPTPPKQWQQQEERRGMRPQPSSLSTSPIDSAATLVASPLSSFRHGGASSYQPVTDIPEDYMSFKGAGAEQKQNQQSPSPSWQQQECSPLSPSSGSGTFAGHRPQGLGVRYVSGATKVVWQGPPPVSRGNAVSPASPEAGGGEAGGLFRGLESHLEEEEEAEAEREKDYKWHKRATSFGTLDSGRRPILSYCPSPPHSPFLFLNSFC